jgi:hypothetical protein
MAFHDACSSAAANTANVTSRESSKARFPSQSLS